MIWLEIETWKFFFYSFLLEPSTFLALDTQALEDQPFNDFLC